MEIAFIHETDCRHSMFASDVHLSNRFPVVNLSGKPFHLSTLAAYAATTQCTEEEIEILNCTLDNAKVSVQTAETIGCKDIDFNAQIFKNFENVESEVTQKSRILTTLER